MSSQRSFSRGWTLAAIFLASFFSQVSGLSAVYCSPQNTAQTPANSSIYQSTGYCFGACIENYAFAILQDYSCWCSNEAPGVTTSTSDCNLVCPGYPDDLCGSANGLFGYLTMTLTPTATAPDTIAAAPTTPVQVTVTETPDPSTIVEIRTETASPMPIISPPSTESSSSIPSTSSASSLIPTFPTSDTSHNPTSTPATTSSSATTTWTPTPVMSLETVTGQVRTVTVTPTVPPNSDSTSALTKVGHGGGLSTGGAVGLTVGLVALVALVCSIIYFCISRRRKDRQREAEAFAEGSRRGSSSGLGGPIPSRTMSENSRFVLGTDGRQVVETWEPESRDTSGSRKSRLMPVDPRLDPFAPVYQRGENRSRESVNTLRDDHDYSRRVVHQQPILRATNPDD